MKKFNFLKNNNITIECNIICNHNHKVNGNIECLNGSFVSYKLKGNDAFYNIV